MMKVNLLLIVLFLFSGCNSILQPKITNRQVENDIIGKEVKNVNGGMFIASWVFTDKEPRCVNIVENTIGNNKAIIVAEVATAGNSDGVNSLGGRVRLDYENIGDKWVVQKVENINFGYASDDATSKANLIELKNKICKEGFDNGKGKSNTSEEKKP